MNTTFRALLMPALASLAMFAILVSLGTWQLRRLQEKEALIARVESRIAVAPQDPPSRSEWSTLKPEDFDFLHVRLSGRYAPEHDALIYGVAPTSFGSEPGLFVITPFRLASGGVVLVDRGFLSRAKAADPARRLPPTDETTIVGVLRAPQARSSFTPANDPSRNIWYTRDPAMMASAWGLSDVAPFMLTLDANGDVGADAPKPVAGKPEFANSHLSYAFTWFALALADIVIFVIHARGEIRRSRLAPPPNML